MYTVVSSQATGFQGFLDCDREICGMTRIVFLALGSWMALAAMASQTVTARTVELTVDGDIEAPAQHGLKALKVALEESPLVVAAESRRSASRQPSGRFVANCCRAPISTSAICTPTGTTGRLIQ